VTDPPVNDAVTELVAGGTYDFEITGNKAFTSMGRGLCCQSGTFTFFFFIVLLLVLI